MPDSIERYRLVAQEDLRGCRHPAGTQVIGVYLSEVALVVSFQVDTTEGSEPGRSKLRDELPVTMRVLQDRVRRFGVECPAVAVLHEGRATAPEDAGNDAFRKVYGELAADQAWHRGEFVVFVEGSRDAANDRLRDLLDPEPPGQEIAASGPTLQDIVDSCKNNAEENSLLSKLVSTWQDEISGNRDDEQTAAGEIDQGVQAIRNHLTALKSEANVLLEELD
jgi:hypothetical protein